jgi:NAD(P)H dehydrogenase (quinone)
MPKILVVYDSKSGNTETMALAVAKGAEQAGDLEVTVKKAEETKNSDLLAADGIIMGSPTYFGQMSAFTSSGGTASGGETTLLSIVQAMLIHGMIVQGRAGDKHYGVAVTGASNKEDLAECEELGKRVATLVLRLSHS